MNSSYPKLIIIHGVPTVGKSHLVEDYAAKKIWRSNGFDLCDSDALSHALHGSWGDGPSDPERARSVRSLFDSIVRYRSDHDSLYRRWYVLVTNNYAIAEVYRSNVIASFGRPARLVAKMMSDRQPDLWPDSQAAMNYITEHNWTLSPLPYAPLRVSLEENKWLSDYNQVLLRAACDFRLLHYQCQTTDYQKEGSVPRTGGSYDA